jgi:hypothetical protein
MRLYRIAAAPLIKPTRGSAVSRILDECLSAANKVTSVLPIMTSPKGENDVDVKKAGRLEAFDQRKES